MLSFKDYLANEGYNDLTPAQKSLIANKIQMALMQRSARKTGDKIDDAALKWIMKRGKRFRDKIERGDFDTMIDKMEPNG
jgi:hypothetical protein